MYFLPFQLTCCYLRYSLLKLELPLFYVCLDLHTWFWCLFHCVVCVLRWAVWGCRREHAVCTEQFLLIHAVQDHFIIMQVTSHCHIFMQLLPTNNLIEILKFPNSNSNRIYLLSFLLKIGNSIISFFWYLWLLIGNLTHFQAIWLFITTSFLPLVPVFLGGFLHDHYPYYCDFLFIYDFIIL